MLRHVVINVGWIVADASANFRIRDTFAKKPMIAKGGKFKPRYLAHYLFGDKLFHFQFLSVFFLMFLPIEKAEIRCGLIP